MKEVNDSWAKEIGERIAIKRKQMKYGQEELAALVGKTRGSVGNYESGGNLPSFEVIVKIAEVLRTTTDYLLRGIESEAGKELPSMDNVIIQNQQKLIIHYEEMLRNVKKQADKVIKKKKKG